MYYSKFTRTITKEVYREFDRDQPVMLQFILDGIESDVYMNNLSHYYLMGDLKRNILARQKRRRRKTAFMDGETNMAMVDFRGSTPISLYISFEVNNPQYLQIFIADNNHQTFIKNRLERAGNKLIQFVFSDGEWFKLI